MTDELDDDVRRLVAEMDDAAPAPLPFSAVAARRRRVAATPSRRIGPLVAAAALTVVVIIVTLVVVNRGDDSRVVTVPPTTPVTPVTPATTAATSSTSVATTADPREGLLSGLPAGATDVIAADLAAWRQQTAGVLTGSGGGPGVSHPGQALSWFSRAQRTGSDRSFADFLAPELVDAVVTYGPTDMADVRDAESAAILLVGGRPDGLASGLRAAGYTEDADGLFVLQDPAATAYARFVDLDGSRLAVGYDEAAVTAVAARLDAATVDAGIADAAAQTDAPLWSITGNRELQRGLSDCDLTIVVGWYPDDRYTFAVHGDDGWLRAEGRQVLGGSTPAEPSAGDVVDQLLTEACGVAPTPTTSTTAELTPDRAAEIAAPGSVAALELFGRLPSTRPAEEFVELNYIDQDAIYQLLDIDRAAPPEAQLEARYAAFLVPYHYPTLFTGSNDAVPADIREEVGFDITGIRREARIGGLPLRITAADVDVDPSLIDGAVRTDPSWSDLLTTGTDEGVTFYDWSGGQPYSQDLTSGRRGPMHGQLGNAGQLLVEPRPDGATIVRTADIADMLAVAGLDPADSILDQGPYATALGRLPAGRLVQATGSNRLPSKGDPDSQLADDALTIAPVESILYTLTIDDTGLHTSFLLTHADEELAAANVQRITDVVERGVMADTGEPVSSVLPDAEITVDGPVVRVTVDRILGPAIVMAGSVFATD